MVNTCRLGQSFKTPPNSTFSHSPQKSISDQYRDSPEKWINSKESCGDVLSSSYVLGSEISTEPQYLSDWREWMKGLGIHSISVTQSVVPHLIVSNPTVMSLIFAGIGGWMLGSMVTDQIGTSLETVELDSNKKQIYASLQGLLEKCSKDDWDGHSGKAIDQGSFNQALNFIQALPNELPAPELDVDEDGEVLFDWYKRQKLHFDVTINGGGRLTYVGIFDSCETSGIDVFTNTIPEIILCGIKRVYKH